MTDTAVAIRSVAVGHDRPDLYHVTCCVDENLSVCGEDITDLEWGLGTGMLCCAVCHTEEHTDFCPKSGTCPPGVRGDT